jgi:hypothetical protein
LTIEFTRTQQGSYPCKQEQSTFDKSTPVLSGANPNFRDMAGRTNILKTLNTD